jgi:hypothetical protein
MAHHTGERRAPKPEQSLESAIPVRVDADANGWPRAVGRAPWSPVRPVEAILARHRLGAEGQQRGPRMCWLVLVAGERVALYEDVETEQWFEQPA